MLVLIGIPMRVLGFALRANPLSVVAAAAAATGPAAGMTPLAILRSFGHAFNANRYVPVIYIVPPVIGLLRARAPTAFAMVVANLLLLYWLAFPA